MKITYGSVCSGIEAATVAWEGFGFKPEWFSEIEPFPSAVLAHHWPHVPNEGDMTMLPLAVSLGELPAPDILVGGTPCQAFSVAGERKGLDDERGQLTLSYVKLANAIDEMRIEDGKQPCVIMWENVPGVLSSKDNAFGCFLAALVGEDEELKPTGKKWSNAGYVSGPERDVAWRILDAQYFGVPQRRRRVFLVASARTDVDLGELLFESESLRRDTPPSRSKREDITPLTGRSSQGFIDESYTDVAGTITQGFGARGVDLDQISAGGGAVRRVVSDQQHFRKLARGEYTDDDHGSTLLAHESQEAGDLIASRVHETYALAGNMISRKAENGGNGLGIGEDLGFTLTRCDQHGVFSSDSGKSVIRRLTPTECERLQGFPDNHTKVPYRNKPADKCPDAPRYRACGNSMAVPVMRWLGYRLLLQLSDI